MKKLRNRHAILPANRATRSTRYSIRGYQRPTPETELSALLSNLQRIVMRRQKAIAARDMAKAAKLAALEERTRDNIEIALARRQRAMDAPAKPAVAIHRRSKFTVERKERRFKTWSDQ